ncbi:hypothetical protein GM685_07785 [Brucella abortus]|nr:hypothetical protein [Brucella abortus]
MNISEVFIRRPVATILLVIGGLIGGIAAYNQLPVAALPEADFPTINVSAQLAGASPDTMASSVATPLIKQFETIAGIDTISARSSLGNTSITLQFDLKRNIDAAAADVQAAIMRAQRRLPDNLTTPPSYRKTNPADAPVVILALTGDGARLTQMDDIAQNVISQPCPLFRVWRRRWSMAQRPMRFALRWTLTNWTAATCRYRALARPLLRQITRPRLERCKTGHRPLQSMRKPSARMPGSSGI